MKRFIGLLVMGVGWACLAQDRIPPERVQDAKPLQARPANGAPKGRLSDALSEGVPLVDSIEHWVFGRSVELSRVATLNDSGTEIGPAPVRLQAVGSGVVISADYRARRVDTGDPIVVGDIIVGGLIENTGAFVVRLFFAYGGDVTLAPEEHLYVGDATRILGPDPGSNGGVADHLLGPPGGGGTYCWVCECTCTHSAGSCTMRIASTSTESCSIAEGVACECPRGGDKPPYRGTSGECSKVLVPCSPPSQ